LSFWVPLSPSFIHSFILQYWGFNQGPFTCSASTLPFEPHPHPSSVFLINLLIPTWEGKKAPYCQFGSSNLEISKWWPGKEAVPGRTQLLLCLCIQLYLGPLDKVVRANRETRDERRGQKEGYQPCGEL
jgi:hypothetical protein